MSTLIGTAPDQVPVNGMLGDMAFQSKAAVTIGTLTSKGTTTSDAPTLGTEFITSSASWTTSTGWTGNNTTGWVHATGNSGTLTYPTAAVSGTQYQISYTVTSFSAGSFTVTFGGQSLAGITATGTFGPTATTTGNLVITPTSTFVGTIVLSIKEITAASTALITALDSTGTSRFEVRASSALYNTFLGVGSGRYNTTGYSNSAVGTSALIQNTTGASNIAVGVNSLASNTTGSNNSAVGVASLYSNTTGLSNSAVGLSALYSNTTGGNNSAVGTSALYSNTTGSNNSAVGLSALYYNTTGASNIAVGVNSLASNTTGSNNSAVGVASLYSNTTGSNLSAFGYQALYANLGNNNSAFGYYSLRNNTLGVSNTAIGLNALVGLTSAVATLGTVTGGTGYTNGTYTGVQLTYLSGTAVSPIGSYPIATIVVVGGAVDIVTLTSYGVGFKDTTTVMTCAAASIGGSGSGFSVPVATLATGSANTAIGTSAGSAITTGSNNVIIGGYSGAAAPISATGSNYIVLSDGAGNVRQVIDSSGNVGIGTTSPGSIGKLTVSNIATTDNSRIGVVATAYLSTPTYTGTFLTQGDTATTGTVCGLSNANLGSLLFQNVSAGLIYTNGNPLIFGTASVEALRINTTQDVSIPAGQLVITNANNTATGGGQIYLNGATGNRIDFSTNGSAAPAFTTRSVGTRIVLYPGVNAAATDFALGMENNTLWTSVSSTAQMFKWYGGTTLAATLLGTGNLNLVGNVGVGGATASTSGSGITFPATQSASSDANTLDDYEKGTWTPVLTFATTGTMTYTASTASGVYTKIGNVVTCRVALGLSAFTAGTASGQARISLPFTSAQNYFSGSTYATNFTTTYPTLLLSGAAVSYVSVYGNTAINTTPAGITPANFQATSQVLFSITYTV